MVSLEDYDEFGNYIGADLESDEEDGIQRDHFLRQPPQHETAAPLEGYGEETEGLTRDEGMEVDGMRSFEFLFIFSERFTDLEPVHNLHEDKHYCPSASNVYGHDVETMVQEEDAQPLTEPIIAPVKVRK